MIRRIVEIALAATALVIFSPLLLLAIIAIRMETPGSAIFRQKRVGRNEKVFTCYKLRTMYVGTPEAPTHLTNPSSVTTVGRLLRKTKIDELPQLFNVLKGTMSFVGPRPCLVTQHDVIAVRRIYGVFSVRPGITGLAQLSGIGMEAPERLAMLDAQYIRSASVSLDLRLILATALSVLFRRQFRFRQWQARTFLSEFTIALTDTRVRPHS